MRMRSPCSQTSVLALLLLGTAPHAHAALSLDGSHCVIFEGSRPQRESAQCVVFTAGSHTLTISLHGTAPNQVTEVVFSRDGAPPFQRLRVGITPLITPTDVGLLITDMNFDGHLDVGLMKNNDPGARGGLHHLLFDPAANRFIPSPFLNTRKGLKFDAQGSQVVSTRRKTGRVEVEKFAWKNGKYVIVERTIRDTRLRTCKRLEYTWTSGRQSATETPCKSR